MITQIYEIQTPEEAEACAALGADHIGSVLVSRDDWRQPVVRQAARRTRQAGKKHCLIPLFGGVDDVSRALDYYEPDIVHFCDALVDSEGRLLPPGPLLELQESLHARFPGLQIMRSIPVRAHGSRSEAQTLEAARAFEAASDWLLIDTWLGAENPEGFIGITGRTADRDVSAELVRRSRVPVILAGGLSPENVHDAVLRVRPAGVDSCTLTNARGSDGKPIRFRKDLDKVGRFVREARDARV